MCQVDEAEGGQQEAAGQAGGELGLREGKQLPESNLGGAGGRHYTVKQRSVRQHLQIVLSFVHELIY